MSFAIVFGFRFNEPSPRVSERQSSFFPRYSKDINGTFDGTSLFNEEDRRMFWSLLGISMANVDDNSCFLTSCETIDERSHSLNNLKQKKSFVLDLLFSLLSVTLVDPLSIFYLISREFSAFREDIRSLLLEEETRRRRRVLFFSVAFLEADRYDGAAEQEEEGDENESMCQSSFKSRTSIR